MKNNFKYKTYCALLLIGAVCFAYIILIDYPIATNLEAFPDSLDYKVQSEKKLFSIDFFSPKPNVWFSPRPFSTPLFYKSVSSNPYNMILLQKIIYCFSILTLIFSLLKHVSNYFVKIVLLYILLYFFTWWNIVGWSSIILSESLSMSLMFLWFAMILFYYKKQSSINLFALICSSIILSFTRDTWPYIIMAFAIINLILFIFFKNRSFQKNFFFFLFSISLFLIQNYTSNIW